MDQSLKQLVEQMGEGDSDTRARVVDQLTQRGKEATPALIEALKSKDKMTRSLAAQGLAIIRDPASADALYSALDDSDGEVRSQAAGALTRMNDPRDIEALVRTIDDFEDVLHYPYTLSVYHLAALGKKALPAVAPLLDAKSVITRTRAITVMRDILKRLDAKDPDRPKMEELLGKYDPEAAASARHKASKALTEWIEKNA